MQKQVRKNFGTQDSRTKELWKDSCYIKEIENGMDAYITWYKHEGELMNQKLMWTGTAGERLRSGGFCFIYFVFELTANLPLVFVSGYENTRMTFNILL